MMVGEMVRLMKDAAQQASETNNDPALEAISESYSSGLKPIRSGDTENLINLEGGTSKALGS
jgi:hypothetical protein